VSPATLDGEQMTLVLHTAAGKEVQATVTLQSGAFSASDVDLPYEEALSQTVTMWLQRAGDELAGGVVKTPVKTQTVAVQPVLSVSKIADVTWGTAVKLSGSVKGVKAPTKATLKVKSDKVTNPETIEVDGTFANVEIPNSASWGPGKHSLTIEVEYQGVDGPAAVVAEATLLAKTTKIDWTPSETVLLLSDVAADNTIDWPGATDKAQLASNSNVAFEFKSAQPDVAAFDTTSKANAPKLVLNKVGDVTLTVSQAKSAQYTEASEDITFKVVKPTVADIAVTTKAWDGKDVPFELKLDPAAQLNDRTVAIWSDVEGKPQKIADVKVQNGAVKPALSLPVGRYDGKHVWFVTPDGAAAGRTVQSMRADVPRFDVKPILALEEAVRVANKPFVASGRVIGLKGGETATIVVTTLSGSKTLRSQPTTVTVDDQGYFSGAVMKDTESWPNARLDVSGTASRNGAESDPAQTVSFATRNPGSHVALQSLTLTPERANGADATHPLIAGESFMYRIVLTAAADVDLSGVQLDFELPDALELTPSAKVAGGRAGWNGRMAGELRLLPDGTTLDRGKSLTLRVPVTVRTSPLPGVQTTQLVSTVTAYAENVEGRLSASDSLTAVWEQDEKVYVMKAVDKKSAQPGEELVYTIDFANRTDQPLTSFKVNDATPAHTTFVSAECESDDAFGCHVSEQPKKGNTGEIEWQFDNPLPAGAGGRVIYRVQLDAR
jgi:uncharacterized repeat protein (TIGR01451 family)